MLRKMLYLVLVTQIAVLATGCATTAPTGSATAGTVYFMGSAEKTYQANVEKAYKAALDVFEDAGIAPYAKSIDATSARVEGTFTDGKTLKVTMKAVGANVTEVKIRVGTLGDVSRSNFIIEKMNKQLE
jgi:hypothetical protein